MKSPVSIALFFLLSGFFLALLLGSIERNIKLLAVAGACLAAIVCIIVFLHPVEWPTWHAGGKDPATTSTTLGTTTTSHLTATTGASGAGSH